MKGITYNRIYTKVKRELAIHFFKRRNDPSLMIIGAQKAATSSVAYYLSQHPQFEISKNKEVHFFDRDNNYSKGLNWYRQQFVRDLNANNQNKIFFEATPDYVYRKNALPRIHQYYPDIKLIFILRNPIERAYSAWNMYRDFSSWKKMPSILYSGYISGKENNIYKEFYSVKKFPDFEECVEKELAIINDKTELEEPALIRRGIYIKQLENIYKFFPAKNVLILGFKDVIKNHIESLNKILSFLNVKDSEWNFLNKETINSRTYDAKLNSGTLLFLENFYAEHNEKLFNHLGYKPNW